MNSVEPSVVDLGPVLRDVSKLSGFSAILTVLLVSVAYLAYKRLRPHSLFHLIPGPPNGSILAGNLLELSTNAEGLLPLVWRKHFHENTVLRIKGPFFAGDGLFISDPTALWRVYDTSDTFIRPPSMTAIGERLLGKHGIVLAEGETHHRIKRIMQPAFNGSNVRNLLPHFKQGASALITAWGNIVDESTNPVVDVFDWLGASALDMIALAAFGVKLGAVGRMQGDPSISDLADAYKGFLETMGAEESAFGIFIRYSPSWLMYLISFLPIPMMRAAENSLKSSSREAAAMVRERIESIEAGEVLGNDVLTLMLKANMDADAKLQLREEEVTAQVNSLFFAGHGTSAAFMSWLLYHIAHDTALQDRLRDEILSMAPKYDAEEDANIFSARYMPLFDSYIREVMRYYPVVHYNEKMSATDTVLPLSKPLVLKSGERVMEIPCPKGTVIYSDIVSCNYSKVIFGDDADVFRPERWLEESAADHGSKLPPSVYAGLFNFVAGPKACLGWRFLLLEVQVMLFELVRNFKFKTTCTVHKRTQMVMVPIVQKGEHGELTVALPLEVERVDI